MRRLTSVDALLTDSLDIDLELLLFDAVLSTVESYPLIVGETALIGEGGGETYVTTVHPNLGQWTRLGSDTPTVSGYERN